MTGITRRRAHERWETTSASFAYGNNALDIKGALLNIKESAPIGFIDLLPDEII